MSHNGKDITVNYPKACFHIEKTASSALRLYLPRDSLQRRRGYVTQLPTDLRRYCGVDDMNAGEVFAKLVKEDQDLLDDILEYHGIVEIPGIEPPSNERSGDVERPSMVGSDRPATSSSISSRRIFQFGSIGNVFSPATPRTATSVSSEPLHSTNQSRVSVGNEHLSQASSSDGQYRNLINCIIQGNPEFPQHGSFDLANLQEALNLEGSETAQIPANLTSPFGQRADGQVAHDMKIGAAGELYVGYTLVCLRSKGSSRS